MRQGLVKRIINAEGQEWQEGQVGGCMWVCMHIAPYLCILPVHV